MVNLARLIGSNAKAKSSKSFYATSSNLYLINFCWYKKIKRVYFNFDLTKNSIESENIMKILANLKHDALPSLPHTKIKKNSVELMFELTPRNRIEQILYKIILRNLPHIKLLIKSILLF